MSTTLDNTNEFLNDDIHEALERLGFLFPKTISDFIEIEKDVNKKPRKRPEQLEDPYKFLNQRVYTDILNGTNIKETDYSQNFAQAAREGKSISVNIKDKMLQDKLKSRQQNNKK